MKRIINVITMMVLCYTFGMAQNNNDKLKEDWGKLVDYVNCQYVMAYCGSEDSSFSEEDTKSYNDKIKPVLENCKIGNSIDFDSLSCLLKKNGWKSTVNNLVRKIEERKNIEEKTIEKLIEIGNLDGFSKKLENRKDELKKEITEHYQSEDSGNTYFSGNRLLWIVIGIEGLLVFALIGFCAHLRSHLPELIKKTAFESKRLEDKFGLKSEENKFQSPNCQKVNDDKESIEELKREVGKLEERIRKLEECKVAEHHNDASDFTKKNEQEHNQEPVVKYLKDVGPNGIFNQIFDAPQNCYFKMFDIKDDSAKFEFVGDVEKAIANKDAVFDNTCETSGTSRNAKNIKTEEAGELKLQNGKWQVTKKAKIKFE